MKAEIHTIININFDCENKYIDKVWILENPNPNEYAEMLEKEFDKYVHKLFEDDEDMEITSIKTEIKSIEDIPKKDNCTGMFCHADASFASCARCSESARNRY